MPPGQIAQLVGHLDGRVGATGGARAVPSDATVARSGVAATISGDVAGSVQQATQSQPTPQVQTVSVSALQSSANIGTVQSQGSSVIQQAYTAPTPSGTIFGTTTGTTSATASNIINTAHLTAATLNVQTLLIILGVGIGLALLTSLIPTWFVAHLKPAQVLRKAN